MARLFSEKPVIPYDLIPFKGEMPMALMADGTPIQQTLSIVDRPDADVPMRRVQVTDGAAASLRQLVDEKCLRFAG